MGAVENGIDGCVKKTNYYHYHDGIKNYIYMEFGWSDSWEEDSIVAKDIEPSRKD